MILHWSNLAFDCEITLKRTIKVSSIISSKKILSQVTVSVKNGHRRVQIAQSAIISLNIVNGSLGREGALFVGVQRGERNLQHLWRKQQLIHQRLATWRKKMTPMCCIKKLSNRLQDDLSAYGKEMPIFGITRNWRISPGYCCTNKIEKLKESYTFWNFILHYCLIQKCNVDATIPLQNMKAKTIPSKE